MKGYVEEKERQSIELVSDQNLSPKAPPRNKRARKEGAKEMSGEERLPEKQWRRVVTSGSLRGRKSKEMIQSNTSSPRWLEVPVESQKEVMAVKVLQNDEISGGGNRGRKGVVSAIRQRANRGSINIME